ncbi:MAG: molybdopterin-dependent oxidoreductase [Boseongicola sp. SB0664_bin_43]|uniref:Molybdopterin-dependent oxidoreductase n=1 Tax=Boseongicola sp. SB0664_bin_43 TaxID=2604844 RepID=A0A6B0XYP5_9RHOB|nr:molybdopterin-dependent oxidoreductase [Boseongicola sp. SB0664_bin_43]
MQAEYRKDLFSDERSDDLNVVGKPIIRQDILGHVTGRSRFYDDHAFDGLLHMRCVRSPHHHARIRSVDSSSARQKEGVALVLEARDVPVNMNTLLSLINFGRDDEPLLATGKVSYVGQPILAIVATSVRAAQEAVDAVKVDYEELPHVLDVEEALKPEAPIVNEEYPNNTFDYFDTYDHQKLRFGDVESAFSRADRIVEGEYQMSPIEQAPIETCGAIAAPETNDRITVHTATQALFFSVGVTAKHLDINSARLHFIGGTVGGGFGGKVDSHHEPLAALACLATGRPVKYMWDRAEEMQVGAPRGGERWRIKDGVLRDGRIVARAFTGFFDAGAYTRLSSYAVQKSTGHLPGPYSIPNVASNVYCVFTNRTPSTAMRGFGITAVDFAIERHMDKVARAIGMDPIELRILNAYRDGDMKAHRREAKNCALIECCQVVAQKTGWSLTADAMRASSKAGGGEGELGAIPATVTDGEGRLGERKRSGLAPEPFSGQGSRGLLPEGHSSNNSSALGNAPQRADMEAEVGRLGFKGATRAPAASQGLADETVPAPAPVAPGEPASRSHPAAGAGSGPSLPAAYTQRPAGTIERPTARPPERAPGTPAAQQPETPPAVAEDEGAGAATHFQRGVRRPGVSRFISGSRRR